MEFWAVEVKSGEPVKVDPGEDMVLHLSQVSLGECKKEKGNESVCLFLNVDGKKLVLATLLSDKLPQQQLDLVFDKDFELSHNWKNGNVYFYGYKTRSPFEDDDDMGDFDSESEEEIPLTLADNGKPETKVKEEKPAEAKKGNAEKDSGAGKQKVKIVEPNRDSILKNEEDDSTDEDDSMSEDEVGSMDEDEDESDSEESDELNESDEEETPKKVETGKKRLANSAVKTPAQDKKAKLTTPQKTDGKKAGGHVATPYPSKPAGKTPANKNQQTPKSGGGGSHACKSCNRTFNSESAVESHTKAKHSTGK